jgi:hypothetical protein
MVKKAQLLGADNSIGPSDPSETPGQPRLKPPPDGWTLTQLVDVLLGPGAYQQMGERAVDHLLWRHIRRHSGDLVFSGRQPGRLDREIITWSLIESAIKVEPKSVAGEMILDWEPPPMARLVETADGRAIEDDGVTEEHGPLRRRYTEVRVVARDGQGGPSSDNEEPAVVEPETAAADKGGRPGVRATAVSVFRDRRSRNLPLGNTAIDEAREILNDWPPKPAGPARPRAETIRDHISRLWAEENAKRRSS